MKKEENKSKMRVRLDLSSKLWRTFLIILTAFLTFAGPTYVVYALIFILKVNYFVSMISGFVLLMAGIALVWYLIKSKNVS